ncbi:Apple-like protein [Gossypium australe]|uniref:Receptor-like serine/threonine-protein kinase n=1 Tax=Gossypium australe TaxID=47621 RepID=A0A5B6VDI3_9ROSI|nr:Apple-like protein [Gossypium australe]
MYKREKHVKLSDDSDLSQGGTKLPNRENDRESVETLRQFQDESNQCHSEDAMKALQEWVGENVTGRRSKSMTIAHNLIENSHSLSFRLTYADLKQGNHLSCSSAVSSLSRGLKQGSSISVEQANDVLTSADGTFSAGFHPVGNNAYCFAIWLNKPPCTTHNCTIVWMANRDFPVNGKHSKLTLLRSGNLVWKANTVSNLTSSLYLELYDSGNLVLHDSDGSFFTLYFDPNNVLNLVYQSPEVSSVYWPDPSLLSWEAGRSMYNTSGIAVLSSFGDFSSTDGVNFFPSDFGSMIQRMLKLDFDGNLRLYSRKGEENWVVSWKPSRNHAGMLKLDFDGNLRLYSRKGEENWVVSWQAFSQPCRIHGSCEPNSAFNSNTLKVHRSDGIYCYPKAQLLNGRRSDNLEGDMYLKLPKVSLSSFNKASDQDYKLDCSTKFEELGREYPKSHESESLKLALWSAGAIGIVEVLSIFFVLWLLIRTRQHSGPVQGYFLATSSIRRFTYAELKKATKSFTEEIGRGAGGVVYKGKLSDGRIAAIKRLIDANHQGEAEFLVEVDTIGRLHHMNVIEMWGYCTEGKQRLLIYEYMEHGSLAKSLSFQSIDWRNRFEIAIGTAKGLAYLHEECLEWVLHCDIKPENILLDSSYQPRVTDFGLSWLLNRGDVKYSGFSRIRGTRGYMAPEWVSNHPITSKVDVYSHGIVVLVLVTGRNPGMGAHSSEDGEGGEDQTSLVKWVKEQMKRSTEAETWTGCKDMLDPALEGKCDIDEMLILVTIALKCVQEDKDDRPTMGQVVEMLVCRENNFAAKALSIARSLTHAL